MGSLSKFINRRAVGLAGALLFLTVPMLPTVAGAQGVLRGVLYDDATGTPLRGTVMLVDPTTDAPVAYNATDSAGQFDLKVRQGTYRIAAVSAGYKSIVSALVAFNDGERLTVRVPIRVDADPTHQIGVLEHVRPGDKEKSAAGDVAPAFAPAQSPSASPAGGAAPTPLKPDTVTAPMRSPDKPSAAKLTAYESRGRRGSGLYYDGEKLERSHVTTVGEFLQTVPGVSVRDPTSASSIELSRNIATAGTAGFPGSLVQTCYVGWFLDGRRIDIPGTNDPMTDALARLPLANVTAVEVFRGLSEMPAEFAAPDLRCGAISIWTSPN